MDRNLRYPQFRAGLWEDMAVRKSPQDGLDRDEERLQRGKPSELVVEKQ